MPSECIVGKPYMRKAGGLWVDNYNTYHEPWIFGILSLRYIFITSAQSTVPISTKLVTELLQRPVKV